MADYEIDQFVKAKGKGNTGYPKYTNNVIDYSIISSGTHPWVHLIQNLIIPKPKSINSAKIPKGLLLLPKSGREKLSCTLT